MIDATLVLSGYLQGVFPMADHDGTIYWYEPDPRAIIPIHSYKPAKSLRPVLNKGIFEIRLNTAFEDVIRQCSLPRSAEDGVWISEEIIQVYLDLHDYGFAHSIEAWHNGELAGGLYGVALGKVFFGESMFYKVPNASKVAFHYLIERLKERDFQLLDTQFINDNVLRYGAIEIPKEDFLEQLERNVSLDQLFYP
ncbi:leucyl/phenylalanyl-tRNA/protein transferase [Leadbetterella byssophila DSM 17132]|uniref:Leucyl/phenylalanyl-tRNA--protein transferase n=1 Tax=Leadbetterella byssophila (strain DSM 17132 / JCM 16389 / KACC 11308 / NBRC 106382 / 4M15) TaxID=649349 RepID=E4RTI3_LEAB4|nr:leucyl/phenylalanyl-tRNA--protein transferase [Leadbetterella byssophila]ADQ16840.1 leucyl/phenylalanyl-tRNA/protein transferase [Leadbetterella byssophila DSM 17132]